MLSQDVVLPPVTDFERAPAYYTEQDGFTVRTSRQMRK
jgi:hypothetical protein